VDADLAILGRARRVPVARHQQTGGNRRNKPWKDHKDV
jgi:hypothetical protein